MSCICHGIDYDKLAMLIVSKLSQYLNTHSLEHSPSGIGLAVRILASQAVKDVP